MAAQESELNTNNLPYIANAIYDLYSNKRIKEYVPSLNKKRGGMNDKIGGMFVNDEISQIYGIESIESILKKTIYANVPKMIEQTPNGIIRDKLHKGIGLLKTYITNISANNNDGRFNDEINRKNTELSILENKYAECLENGNFEKITDYQSIAYFALKLLSAATVDQRYRKNNNIRIMTDNEKNAKELYDLILKKFGKVKNDDNSRNRYNGNEFLKDGGTRDNGENKNNRANMNYRDGRDNRTNMNYRDSRNNREYQKEREYVPSYKKFLGNSYNDRKQNNYVPQYMKENEYEPSFLRDECTKEKNEIKKENIFIPLVSETESANVGMDTKLIGAWTKKMNCDKLKNNKIELKIKEEQKREVTDSDSDEWKIE